MQQKYSPEKLNVILLSTDVSQAMYDQRSPRLFAKYGGDQWPSIVLPNAMEDTLRFGGFGYGKIIVDEQGIVRSLYEHEFQTTLDEMFLLGTLHAKSKVEADTLGGYWYRNKCWRTFNDEGIANQDIDRVVRQQLSQFKKAQVELDEQTYGVQHVFAEKNEKGFSMRVVFNDGEEIKIVCRPANMHGDKYTGTAKCYLRIPSESGDSGVRYAARGKVTLQFSPTGAIRVSGTLHRRGGQREELPLNINCDESSFQIGSSELEIDGEQALLSGVLGTVTYDQFKNLIEQHPAVKTVTLTNIEGSVNDEAVRHTGRILRAAGLNTRLFSDSEIVAGGVNLFCAGAKRVISRGAKLGVRSWNDGTFDGKRYPQDHPAHQYQLDYFRRMLGQEPGAEFYFHTLSAAVDEIHYLNDNEIKKWKIGTEFVEENGKSR